MVKMTFRISGTSSRDEEWFKRKPNEEFVQQLMKFSYPYRRQWFLSKPHFANEIFTQCTFLLLWKMYGPNIVATLFCAGVCLCVCVCLCACVFTSCACVVCDIP